MFIVKIKGGLGNQLFQFAIGLELSTRNSESLALDLSWFENSNGDTERAFKLHNYVDNYNIASSEQVENFIIVRSVMAKRLFRMLNRLMPLKDKHYIVERDNHFNPGVLSQSGDVYLDGTWMNESYFSTVKLELKKLYSKRPILSYYHQEIEGYIRSCNSVSVHVRRGDYANNLKTLKYHGLLDYSYYDQTISFIKKRLEKPTFFFFSDDIEWVERHFGHFSDAYFVSEEDVNSDISEFYLMMNCKNNIVANSTFSWWAAWLNSNEERIVCAPKRWSSKIADSSTFLPSDWTLF